MTNNASSAGDSLLTKPIPPLAQRNPHLVAAAREGTLAKAPHISAYATVGRPNRMSGTKVHLLMCTTVKAFHNRANITPERVRATLHERRYEVLSLTGMLCGNCAQLAATVADVAAVMFNGWLGRAAMSLAEMERLNEVDPDFGMLSTLTAYSADLGRFDARIAQARTHAVAAGDPDAETLIAALETQAKAHRERFSARTGNSEAAVRRTTAQQALLLWATITVAGQDLRDQTRTATGEPSVLIGSDINWDVDLLTDIASAALDSARAPHHLTDAQSRDITWHLIGRELTDLAAHMLSLGPDRPHQVPLSADVTTVGDYESIHAWMTAQWEDAAAHALADLANRTRELATRMASTPAPLQKLTITGYLGYPLESAIQAFDRGVVDNRERYTLLVPTIVAQAIVGEAAKNRHLTVTAQVAGSGFDQLVTLETSMPGAISGGLPLWPDRFTVAADTAGVNLAELVKAAYPDQSDWPTVA